MRFPTWASMSSSVWLVGVGRAMYLGGGFVRSLCVGVCVVCSRAHGPPPPGPLGYGIVSG